MSTLVAEDLLLLLLDDDTGKAAGTGCRESALGGAVLVELALLGAVDVEERTSRWHSAKVSARSVPVADPILAAGLATVGEKARSAEDLVSRLGKGLEAQLVDRLVGRGILQRVEDKVLGLFPRTRWPAVDSSHEEEVRRSLAEVLVEGREPDERTGSLVALLSAIDHAHKVVAPSGESTRELRRRAKAVAEGDWAAQAVRDAITASTAAMVVAATAGAVASSSSGS